jgi:hypothetical protein
MPLKIQEEKEIDEEDITCSNVLGEIDDIVISATLFVIIILVLIILVLIIHDIL